ncbi:hypothetical protein [Xanthomonas phage X2]|nr:hypothetical protein [Xanthomonas phage X2]
MSTPDEVSRLLGELTDAVHLVRSQARRLKERGLVEEAATLNLVGTTLAKRTIEWYVATRESLADKP